tara:strand:- start:3439 stop:3756 length:318 start_codon:yes stop_codon:yes gene_type:complete
MKTNFYIVLTLLLTISVGNAQSETIGTEAKTNNVISVSEMNDEVSVDTLGVENKNEAVLLINASELKETIARTNSDIRIYLNRVNEKKVDNIKLLFPQINKVKKA